MRESEFYGCLDVKLATATRHVMGEAVLEGAGRGEYRQRSRLEFDLDLPGTLDRVSEQ
jgi:hypothetical protein